LQTQKKRSYVISRIINNNVVASRDPEHNEVVLMGKGIAFDRHVNDLVSDDRIEKVFVLKDSEKTRYMDVIENLEPQYLEDAVHILDEAAQMLDMRITPISYITLADHLSSAVERSREGILIPNAMLSELKNFYPQGYELSLKAVQQLNEEYGVQLPEDEAGFITFHLVNIWEETSGKTERRLTITKKVIDVIEGYYGIKLDTSSVYYERFLTHLKYFYSRVLKNELNTDHGLQNDVVFRILKTEYKDAAECADLIGTYLEKEYGIGITEEEKGYLMIHLMNLVNKTKK
jgi:beta-glucoside operon transcriptional antiterminator